MRNEIRRTVVLGLLGAMLSIGTAGVSGEESLVDPGLVDPRQAQDPAMSAVPAELQPEARRLRKLHLVRPDLIPYPIAYDVYC